jgi:hypothetical protein
MRGAMTGTTAEDLAVCERVLHDCDAGDAQTALLRRCRSMVSVLADCTKRLSLSLSGHVDTPCFALAGATSTVLCGSDRLLKYMREIDHPLGAEGQRRLAEARRKFKPVLMDAETNVLPREPVADACKQVLRELVAVLREADEALAESARAPVARE